MTPPPTDSRSRDPELERLGERLKRIRDYLGMSQQFVSDNTGIPRTAVSDIERGERRVDSLELKKLARLYRHPISFFLADEKEPDAGEHVLSGFPRALAQLTDGDQKAVLEYAEFLRFRRAATQEEHAAAPPEDPGPVR
ncbi:putative transcriptional regulator [Streptomyces sp. L-9-10]|uniref:helix-turn-helix domain-containing protein n=1 Tax=Streptomyces sp. L-9-10 TaxID=1478131 RepID=UPI00101C9A17|nr:helix-turn-helix transcriptional regulator [Streptomyces sp. L-9-10]RYJ30699.1 putative transcriptional regulator [Streptomyces sp. L-9-10]